MPKGPLSYVAPFSRYANCKIEIFKTGHTLIWPHQVQMISNLVGVFGGSFPPGVSRITPTGFDLRKFNHTQNIKTNIYGLHNSRIQKFLKSQPVGVIRGTPGGNDPPNTPTKFEIIWT